MFDKLPKYLDDEGDFDEDNLPKPLLYKFVDAKFFEDLYGIPRELEGFDEIQISTELADRQPEHQWLAQADWPNYDYQARLGSL